MTEVGAPPFVRNMGHLVVSYILNIPEETAREVLIGKICVEGTRRDVWNSYIALCRDIRARGLDESRVDSLFYKTLPLMVDGQHVFVTWRRLCGADLPSVEHNDPLVQAIMQLAVCVYPLFLIKGNGGRYYSADNIRIDSTVELLSKERDTALEALRHDLVLGRIFSREGKNFSFYQSSAGSGGTLFLEHLPTTIINSAYELMRLRGGLAIDSLKSAVVEVLGMLRSVVDGNKVDVPVFMGFHNLVVPQGAAIETEHGVLRDYNDGIEEIIPPYARPPKTSGNRSLGFVCESKYTFEAIFGAPGAVEWPMSLGEAVKGLAMAEENLRLLLALSIERQQAVGIVRAWTLRFNPLSGGTSLSSNSNASSPVASYTCTEADVKSIFRWAPIISSVHDKRIRVGLRRILAAINDRINPVDGFVDCVIGWENLFGGQTELSFRISSAMAYLLGDGSEDRRLLQARVAGLYRDRSKVVHGDKELSVDEANKKRDECIALSLKALRVMYEFYPHLLSDVERGRRLILQY